MKRFAAAEFEKLAPLLCHADCPRRAVDGEVDGATRTAVAAGLYHAESVAQ